MENKRYYIGDCNSGLNDCINHMLSDKHGIESRFSNSLVLFWIYNWEEFKNYYNTIHE